MHRTNDVTMIEEKLLQLTCFAFLSLLNVKNQGLNLVTRGQQKSTRNFQQVADVQVYFLSINIFVLTLSDVFYNKKLERRLGACPYRVSELLIGLTYSTACSGSENMWNCESAVLFDVKMCESPDGFKFINAVKEI